MYTSENTQAVVSLRNMHNCAALQIIHIQINDFEL